MLYLNYNGFVVTEKRIAQKSSLFSVFLEFHMISIQTWMRKVMFEMRIKFLEMQPYLNIRSVEFAKKRKYILYYNEYF